MGKNKQWLILKYQIEHDRDYDINIQEYFISIKQRRHLLTEKLQEQRNYFFFFVLSASEGICKHMARTTSNFRFYDPISLFIFNITLGIKVCIKLGQLYKLYDFQFSTEGNQILI